MFTSAGNTKFNNFPVPFHSIPFPIKTKSLLLLFITNDSQLFDFFVIIVSDKIIVAVNWENTNYCEII